MMVGKEDKGFVTVDLEDYQGLKNIEDRVSDVMLCLDSTLDTLKTFVEMHKLHFSFVAKSEHQDAINPAHSTTYDSLLFVLNEKRREVKYAHKKAEALLAKAQNTRALVRRQSWTQHLTF